MDDELLTPIPRCNLQIPKPAPQQKKPNTQQYCFSLIRKLMHDHQKIQTIEKLKKMRATVLDNPHPSLHLTEIHTVNSLR